MPENPMKRFFICGGFLLIILQYIEVAAAERDSSLSIKTLLNRAEMAENDDDYDTAIELYQQLSQMYETHLDFPDENSNAPASDAHADVDVDGDDGEGGADDEVDVFSQLMRTYTKAERYDEALSYAWKFHDLYENNFGQGSIKTVQALYHLGTLYYTKENYEKAEELLKRAYRPTKFNLGQNNRITLKFLSLLSDTYRKTRDPEKLDLARGYYSKIYGVRSKDPNFGKEHADTLRTLFNFAQVLSQQGESTQATRIFQKVLKITTRKLGQDHPLTQEVKHALFFALSIDGKIREAKKVMGKEDQELDQDEQSLLTLVLGKALSLAKAGNFEKALEVFTEYQQQEISKPQNVSPEIFKVLETLIMASCSQDEPDQTLKLAKVMIDLLNDPKVKAKVRVTEGPFRDLLPLLHLYAIESLIDVYSERNDEEQVSKWFKTAQEVIKGQELQPLLMSQELKLMLQKFENLDNFQGNFCPEISMQEKNEKTEL